MTRNNIRGPLLVACAALLSACGAQTLTVTETEYTLTLSQSTARPGDVTFTVANSGHEGHELVLFKTSLAPDQLPLITNTDGTTKVDESSSQLTPITPEVKDISAGTTKSATMHLDAGSYVLICNVPDHYKGGMHAPLTVQQQ